MYSLCMHCTMLIPVYMHIISILFYNNILVNSLTSHKETKGLVMLQLMSCLQRRQLLTVLLNLYLLIHDNKCNLKREHAWIWLVAATFCCGDNSIVAAWLDHSLFRKWWGVTTNIRRMELANTSCVLVWLCKSATILVVVATFP